MSTHNNPKQHNNTTTHSDAVTHGETGSETLLNTLTAGMVIPYGGNKVTQVDAELANKFEAGDRLIVLQDSGDLIHIPAEVSAIADTCVAKTQSAFRAMGTISDEVVTDFYEKFATLLEDDTVFTHIAEANRADIERAEKRGRSTTRLELSDTMRRDMIRGLRVWRDMASTVGTVVERVEHDGWTIEQVKAGLGVIGFIFEGRPNVFADATGVLRSGNTVVFRIGSDALTTAQAIMTHALKPALQQAGLPEGAVSLIESVSRAAGHAMFSDQRLALAVARGSGAAVSQLGSVARQAGIAVSLHGTGGAWMLADTQADTQRFATAVTNSLDRKVCNTLNTCVIVKDRSAQLVPVLVEALDKAAENRNVNAKLHVERNSFDQIKTLLPDSYLESVDITRSCGIRREPKTEVLERHELGKEWEWEQSPEITLVIVDSLEECAELFNSYSPRFVASLISTEPEAHQRFFNLIDAPFVGDGFTRWVDGQFAFNRPELGLSNWSFGRLFGRGAVLSGSSVYTLRSKVTQSDISLKR